MAPTTFTTVERTYVFYADHSNFEAVEARNIGADLCLTWRAAGTGMHRRPVGEIIGDKVIVRGYPISDRYHGDPDAQCIVRGAAGKAVEIAILPHDAPNCMARR